jgi:hypothetical protein
MFGTTPRAHLRPFSLREKVRMRVGDRERFSNFFGIRANHRPGARISIFAHLSV